MESIVIGDADLPPIRHKVYLFDQAHRILSNTHCQAEILHIAIIVFNFHHILIDLGVQTLQVIDAYRSFHNLLHEKVSEISIQ